MEGVDILSTEVVYKVEYDTTPFWVMFVIIGLLVLGTMIYNCLYNDWFEGICWSIGIAFITFLVMILPVLSISSRTTDEVLYIKHKVTIDDTVNFNEFSEHYKIIDQEGKIYTVQER